MILITEILYQMKQGATAPYLCVADNGEKYVIKRNRAGFEGCIKEWMLGKLGHAFGLPIPDCELVYVNCMLLEYNDNYQMEIGEGVAFASQFIDDLQEVNYQQLQTDSSQIHKDLFVFDYWIRNLDRTLTELGGNPNLFFRQSNKNLVVLDHNLALDEEFDFDTYRDLHVCSGFWLDQLDFSTQQNYSERIDNAMLFWDDLVSQIPDDWKDGHADFDGFINQIRLVLNEYRDNIFWERL